jgi:hypothetical protein
MSNLVQTAEADLSADATSGQPTFQDLLDLTIATTGGNLLLWATFAASLAGLSVLPAEIDFQLTVDGTPQRGVGIFLQAANEPEAGSLLARITGLAAGSHVVAIQWRVTNGQTAQCRPFSQPGRESATLVAMETLV